MNRAPVIGFDIGGTWFRSALVMPDRGLTAGARGPAINHLTHPDAPPEALQEALIEWLIAESDRMSDTQVATPRTAAISLGAAVDHRSGQVLGSGPLWGSRAEPFHLGRMLRRHRPKLAWTVLNDVTAHLFDALDRQVLDPGDRHARIMLITVSTGIGARTAQLADWRVPTDRVCGVQGEIGHLPVALSFGDRLWHRRCECGGANHLNAFASGRGIDGLLADIRAGAPQVLAGSVLARDGAGAADLAAAVDRDDPIGHELLDAITRPLADILRTAFTIDPDLRSVFLTGGVAKGFGKPYLDSLAAGFADAGLYQVTDREPAFLGNRLALVDVDDDAGIRGAALAAGRLTDDADTRVGSRQRLVVADA